MWFPIRESWIIILYFHFLSSIEKGYKEDTMISEHQITSTHSVPGQAPYFFRMVWGSFLTDVDDN